MVWWINILSTMLFVPATYPRSKYSSTWKSYKVLLPWWWLFPTIHLTLQEDYIPFLFIGMAMRKLWSHSQYLHTLINSDTSFRNKGHWCSLWTGPMPWIQNSHALHHVWWSFTYLFSCYLHMWVVVATHTRMWVAYLTIATQQLYKVTAIHSFVV